MASERTIRVTNHEREDAIEGLRAAYTLGCLDDGELEERTSLIFAWLLLLRVSGLLFGRGRLDPAGVTPPRV